MTGGYGIKAFMGIRDLFRRFTGKPAGEGELRVDPLHDLVLAKLRVGYLLDYDLKTWEVTAYNRYDFDGDEVEEWELTAGGEKRYLELEDDDGPAFSLSRKIPIGKLGGVRQHVLDHEDPPEEIELEGRTYYLDEMLAGHMYAGGSGPPRELIRWELVDDAGRSFLSVEQWGETELEAAVGEVVEEFQFNNILPGEAKEG